MSAATQEPVAPPEPESLEETGLPESLVEQLVMKILYFRGDIYGQDLSNAIALKFSVIQDIVESLKLQHLVQVKRSMGMGNVAAVMALTEAGRIRTREYLEANQYSGPAPVPMDQYIKVVKQQRPPDGWLTKPALRDAFKDMVISERVLSQIGPAVSSGNSMLIYGKPGDGKTFLIENLNNLDAAPVFVPHAIECQGNIVQLFDPIYHVRLEPDEEPSVLAVQVEHSHDQRWLKCRRPFIVSGGELALDMLDLRFNHNSKIYEAPFQLKANNGVYLIDDFGRQRATPAEVLNRWIVPMERRVDYLSFLTGGKMTAPFETFLVFSTNLNPATLGDEAFLRRIQYKMLMRSPAQEEFEQIFREFCKKKKLPFSEAMLRSFIERHYKRSGKPFRRCHPRDLLYHVLNLIHFEKLPMQLTDELLDRAFESCFLSEDEDAPTASDTTGIAVKPAVPAEGRIKGDERGCQSHWSAAIAAIPTVSGCLFQLSTLKDHVSGGYYEVNSVRDFGALQTSRTLAQMHQCVFQAWQIMTPEQQRDDYRRFAQTAPTAAATLSPEHPVMLREMAPASSAAEELNRFVSSLISAMETAETVAG